MKVILTAKVRNLGNVGDVVEVRNGYGRNFLIPEGQAIVYSVSNYKIFEQQKQKFEEENEKRKATALENQKKIENKKIVLIESASEDGKLYGSVSTTKLATKINNVLGKDTVKKAQLIIKQPIKNTGEYLVTLALHPEVMFDVVVIVATSDAEATTIMKKKTEKAKEEVKEAKSEKKKAEKTETLETEEEVEVKEESEKKSTKKSKKSE